MTAWVFEKKSEFPILILDKRGLIANALSSKLKEETTVVLVTQNKPKESDNIIYIPYVKKIPEIPDNSYSHIFLIDEGDQNPDFLSSFLKKAKIDRSFFLFATYIKSKNQELLKYIQETYPKSKIVFYGDVFDQGATFRSTVDKFIRQARKGRINIPGHGETVIYPVHLDDVVEGLLEVAFTNADDNIFYLFAQHRITILSLAQIIQRINPDVNIDFIGGGVEKEVDLPPEGKFLLSTKYPLEARLRKIDIKVQDSESADVEEEFEETFKNYSDRSPFLIREARFVFVFLFLFLVFLPLLSTLTFTFLGFKTLNNVKDYFEKGDFNKAWKSSMFSLTYFNLSDKSFGLLDKEMVILGQKKKAQEIYSDISYGQDVSEALVLLFEGARSLSKDNSFSSFKKAFSLLQKAKTEKPLKPSIVESIANFGSTTVDVWPQILGFDKQKNYLLIIQDKKNLRPTGGVVSSWASLSIDRGKIKKFSTHNPSEVDSKLEGKVEPPFAIRRYLKTTRWNFADSNFNVDFEEAAITSASFLNLATGEKVDGVFALDSQYFKSLEPYLKEEKNPTFSLLKDFVEKLDNKDLLFAFSDPAIEDLFEVNGWSSSLLDQREEKPSTLNDFIGIIEANFGKGDTISIERKVFQKSKIGENRKISSQFLIEYENKSGEDYKNYLRIILPLGSKINKIKIGDEEKKLIDAITDPEIYEAKNFVSPKGLEIESYDQGGKSIFGFLVEVPKNDKQMIIIDYSLLNQVPSHLTSLSYNLKIFKQPGVDPYLYDFSLSFPDSLRSLGRNSFNLLVSKDLELSINLSQR